jgi:hypothetical protein
MDLADIFYTQGTTSGKVALVQKYACTQCGRAHIRSAADAVTDNALDSKSAVLLIARCTGRYSQQSGPCCRLRADARISIPKAPKVDGVDASSDGIVAPTTRGDFEDIGSRDARLADE